MNCTTLLKGFRACCYLIFFCRGRLALAITLGPKIFSLPLQKIFVFFVFSVLLSCDDTHHTATSRKMNTTSCSSNILILLQFYYWGFKTIPTHHSNTAEILFYYLLLSMVIFLTFHATKNIVTFDKIIIILLTLLIHI